MNQPPRGYHALRDFIFCDSWFDPTDADHRYQNYSFHGMREFQKPAWFVDQRCSRTCYLCRSRRSLGSGVRRRF